MPDEQKPMSPVALFSQMASRIEHNSADSFGGAYVVVPPGGTLPLSLLLIDSLQDPAVFWGTLKTQCEIALSRLAEEQRKSAGWNR